MYQREDLIMGQRGHHPDDSGLVVVVEVAVVVVVVKLYQELFNSSTSLGCEWDGVEEDG
jgi:hypothetical protein